MKTDIEIANEIEMKPIIEIASKLHIENDIEQYGKYKAKIEYNNINNDKKGKLILVTLSFLHFTLTLYFFWGDLCLCGVGIFQELRI